MTDFKRYTAIFRHFRGFGRLLLWKCVKSQKMAVYQRFCIDIDISIDNNGGDGVCVTLSRMFSLTIASSI